ncbi:hypothetical protein [Antarctobacter sp.]|uniref:hypothetical protein n=1 Tax=Antarctobacter sp. TaxID=1872577 RepID=UPI002B26CF57|nr:hypothetical protein [Antarctobacter sp.]
MTSAFTHAAFEEFLKDISEPFLTRDITKWRARMQLPFSMVTGSGPVTLSTDDDVRKNFELYLEACDAMALDIVHRERMGVEHCEDGTVLASYRTNLMRQGKRIADPYTSTALLHPTDDGWKMSAILNARGHHAWTGRHPKNTGE